MTNSADLDATSIMIVGKEKRALLEDANVTKDSLALPKDVKILMNAKMAKFVHKAWFAQTNLDHLNVFARLELLEMPRVVALNPINVSMMLFAQTTWLVFWIH